jgi:hypothetical protein
VSVEIDESLRWAIIEVQPFTRALHGHPTIRSFEGGLRFPSPFLDMLYSTLATLPALESITCYNFPFYTIQNWAQPPKDEYTTLTTLLRLPTLRSVDFRMFHFTPTSCQAVAKILIEGTAITNIFLSRVCFHNSERSNEKYISSIYQRPRLVCSSACKRPSNGPSV